MYSITLESVKEFCFCPSGLLFLSCCHSLFVSVTVATKKKTEKKHLRELTTYLFCIFRSWCMSSALTWTRDCPHIPSTLTGKRLLRSTSATLQTSLVSLTVQRIVRFFVPCQPLLFLKHKKNMYPSERFYSKGLILYWSFIASTRFAFRMIMWFTSLHHSWFANHLQLILLCQRNFLT